MQMPVRNFLLVSSRPWHDRLFRNLSSSIQGNWKQIKQKEELTLAFLSEYQPAFVFVTHWSHIIPARIFEQFNCIVFHMTDLPFGRGGSPLQNLIARGFDKTKISAIRVEKGMDTGAVYLKKDLSLLGTAEEIFIRATDVIEQMIVEIVENKLQPQPQQGDVVVFHRRKPEDGNLSTLESVAEVFDYIRMLDAEGYPNAYVEVGNFRFEFSRAALKNNETIIADVRISKK